MALAGCSLLPIRFGDPYLSGYVVNRDGHYYVGSRCIQTLVEVGVSPNTLGYWSEVPIFMKGASWHATASPPVAEFELYADSQFGVTVVADNGTRPLGNRLTFVVVAQSGRSTGVSAVLADIGPGQVASGLGVITWTEYMTHPRSDFGCSEPR